MLVEANLRLIHNNDCHVERSEAESKHLQLLLEFVALVKLHFAEAKKVRS